jgi:hypothetical protein
MCQASHGKRVARISRGGADPELRHHPVVLERGDLVGPAVRVRGQGDVRLVAGDRRRPRIARIRPDAPGVAGGRLVEDRHAFEVRGSSVLCQSDNQFLNDSGQRASTGQAEPINQLFASNFTNHYQELAQRDPIFADLQGIFDLALVAALIIASDPMGNFSQPAREHLQSIPYIALDPKETPTTRQATVAFSPSDFPLQNDDLFSMSWHSYPGSGSRSRRWGVGSACG